MNHRAFVGGKKNKLTDGKDNHREHRGHREESITGLSEKKS